MAEASISLQANNREGTGKGSSRSLRREGLIPAIIYGNKKDPVNVSIDQKEITKAYHTGNFKSKLVELNLGGEKVITLPRDVQLHPVTDNIEHADFLRVDKDSKIHVFAEVEFINADQCTGLKRGGVLNVVRRRIEFICDLSSIPEKVIIDLAGLNIGDSVHLSQANVSTDAKPAIGDRDFTIATIVGRMQKTDEEQAEEDAAADSDSDAEEGENAEEAAE